MKSFLSSVSPKGQVTLPAEMRRALGIRTRDKVTLRLENDRIILEPATSKITQFFGMAPKLEGITVEEAIRLAAEEHAIEAAYEGLDRA